MNEIKSSAIRMLNDSFRKTLLGGSVFLTAGIIALGAGAPARILEAVKNVDDFGTENDPGDEHDFGSLEAEGELIFFRIDYFDLTRAMHSGDPDDPSKTERTLTLMIAKEY